MISMPVARKSFSTVVTVPLSWTPQRPAKRLGQDVRRRSRLRTS
jgi:hypothetical protein